jgi:hypothetical protein
MKKQGPITRNLVTGNGIASPKLPGAAYTVDGCAGGRRHRQPGACERSGRKQLEVHDQQRNGISDLEIDSRRQASQRWEQLGTGK